MPQSRSAEAALTVLAKMTAFERAALCHKVADVIASRREAFAHDISLEQGKVYHSEALGEVDAAILMHRDSAECATRLQGQTYQSVDPTRRVMTIRQPRGVYGIITPWNFPLTIPSEYLGAGLATGNAMVWKPSEWTPLTSRNLMQAFLDAGVPPGTLNLLLGAPAEVGAARRWPSRHRRHRPHRLDPHRAGGGEARGRQADAARARRQRPDHRLRGQRPRSRRRSRRRRCLRQCRPDLQLDRAHPGAALGARPLRRASWSKPREGRTARLALRRDLDDGAGLERTDGHQGRQPPRRRPREGRDHPLRRQPRERACRPISTIEPTIISGVTTDMLLNREETFGPVAPVLAFEDEDDAIRIAETCPLGLHGSIWTNGIGRALRMSERLRCGTVHVNETSAYWQLHTPTGGFTGTGSGIGRIGGMATLEEMTQLKTISLNVVGA